jgi:formylglycine-generating enzyme required for sulfatase activity
MTCRLSLPALALATLAGCYGHTRRDAPAPPPEEVKVDLVTIPAGRFTMGDRNGDPAEYPEREITMSGFQIDRTEVTNADYARCVQAKACDPTPYMEDAKLGQLDHPVVGVTWIDAERFCQWVKRRLPTEAEWEYAARGTDLRKWPWKGVFDPKKTNSGQDGDFHGATAPVGAYTEGESPFGVLNMAGNAAEWTADFFEPTWYGTSDQTTNPKGPERGRERVVRGGSYRDPSHLVRVSARVPKAPTESDNTIGFRCAK